MYIYLISVSPSSSLSIVSRAFLEIVLMAPGLVSLAIHNDREMELNCMPLLLFMHHILGWSIHVCVYIIIPSFLLCMYWYAYMNKKLCLITVSLGAMLM